MSPGHPPLKGADRAIKASSDKLRNLPGILHHHRWKMLIGYILFTLFLAAGLPGFKLNQSLDAFFKKNDPTMTTYQWFRYTFGSDEFVLVMYQPKDGDVFSQRSMKALHSIEKKLETAINEPGSPLARVTRVRSLISADYLESQDDSLISRPFVGDRLPQTPAESDALRRLALQHRDYPGTWFSRDSSFGIIMFLTDYGARVRPNGSTGEPGAAVAAGAGEGAGAEDEFDFGEDEDGAASRLLGIGETPELEEVPMDAYPLLTSAIRDIFNTEEWAAHHETHFVGHPVLMTFFNNVIIEEIGLFSSLAILIILVVMYILFRSLPALVWPAVTLGSAMLWIMGIVGWSGVEMTFMINIIIFLLLAVSMATSIHILSGYSFFRGHGAGREDALASTYAKSGVPIILAGVTTAIGLVSLVFVPLPAVSRFGMFACTGVLVSLIINLFMWPVFLSFWAPTVKPAGTGGLRWLAGFLASQKKRALNNGRMVVVISLAITGLMGAGIARVYIDTNFIEMIKEGYGITESYDIVDKHFGGTATIEVLLDTGRQDGVKDPALLKALDRFAAEVLEKRKDLVTNATSLVNVAKDSHKNLAGGSEADYRIPDTKDEVSQVLLSFESADPATRKLIVDDNWQVVRLTFSLLTAGTYAYQDMMGTVEQLAAKHLEPLRQSNSEMKIVYSGGVRLMMKLVNLITVSQLTSFSIALGVICLLLFFLYGSFRFGVLAIVPNILPLVFVMGCAGWAGIPLDSDTLLVLPIAIGIAVDDTIHFLTHYKTEVLEGKTSAEAIDSALKKVGMAMTFTTVVLSTGFLIFILSAYRPLTNFGMLSAIAITTALIADLFLLPVLIHRFLPVSIRETTVMKNVVKAGLVLAFGLLLLAPENLLAVNARDIAKKSLDRDDGASSYGKVTLLSCEFREQGGKRKCAAGKRKKVFISIRKDLDKKGDVSRSLSLIVEPASENDVGFLQEDYEDKAKDSQQWMYLPALKKLKRIVSSDGSGPRTGTFFGSEIAYEDLEKRHLDDYTYRYLGEETVAGRKAWIIEMTPVPAQRKKTSYSKNKVWVDQQTYMMVKTEGLDKSGRLAKTFFARRLEQVSGIWISAQQIVINHKNNRMSMLRSADNKVNIDIPEQLVSPRALNDKDYRAQQLGRIR